MPTFIYTAKNRSSGETVNGEAKGNSESTVAGQLRSDGLVVTSIFEKKEKKKNSVLAGLLGTVPLKDRMVFARNLSVMIGSGLSVARALENLEEQVDNEKFRIILREVHGDVSRGQEFSNALEKHPKVFNNLFVSMVRVGEESGTLDQALTIIAEQMEKDHELISKVRGAMIYPSVIVVAMIGVAMVMFTFVLPQITGVFKELGAELPPTTQFVISLSEFMAVYSLYILIGMLATAVIVRLSWKNVGFAKVRSKFFLALPVFGKIVVKVNAARFSRIYSSLTKSGVPVLRSLKIISDTLGNYEYKNALTDTVEQVQKGGTLSKAVKGYSKIFPPLVYQMIEVGEETGKTEEVLLRLAEFYEAEVTNITKNLSSIIEPVLMIIIGTAVGFFALAMMQPMYSVLQNIN